MIRRLEGKKKRERENLRMAVFMTETLKSSGVKSRRPEAH